MKNFPSALIRQKTTKDGLGSTLSDTFKNIATKAMSNIFGGGKSQPDPKTMNSGFEPGYTRPELESLVDEMNMLEDKQETIDIQKRYNQSHNLKYNVMNGQGMIKDKFAFEDPFKLSSSIFSVINNYQYVLGVGLPAFLEGFGDIEGDGTTAKTTLMETAVSPSLFNPFAGVSVIGITENIPLINRNVESVPGSLDNGSESLATGGKISLNTNLWKPRKDIGDCSIKKLVDLSNQSDSELGLATYRYADFMFCKDLGKIPNNRLITLRKFPVPVGDNIFKYAHPKKNDKVFKTLPDIGRLVTWFDNEDNKLEDICRYNYHAKWKEFTSEIQQIESNEQDQGLVSKLANVMSPENNKLVGQGYSGNFGLLKDIAGVLHIPVISTADGAYYSNETLSNYDQHRIYEPQDRIQTTHKYEGTLEFSQEITLTFRYVLRGYSNINPRAAMLDLLGNIHTVTYRRGSFWGGETKMYGAPTNHSVYDKANSLIDKGFNLLGGVWETLFNGEWEIEKLQNFLENAFNKATEVVGNASSTANAVLNGQTDKESLANAAGEDAKKVKTGLENANKKYKFTDALKGMLKNQLGRPAKYAINSLLTGDYVGPWHLTIGNPRNPIMSIGNLILEDSEIQHYGPLGIDDFPTEMKVTVKLKHATPRDIVGIQRMYTQGLSSIYKPMNLVDVKNFATNKSAFGDVTNYDDKVLKFALAGL